MARKGVWGIDVSKSSIKAVRIQPSKSEEGHIELTNIEIIDYSPSAARDDATLDQEIRLAVNTLISRHKFRNDIIAVSLPGHSIFIRPVKIPAISKDRMESIIKGEAQQHIPFPIEEVIWVYQVLEKAYKPDEELDVVFLAIKKEVVDQFLALMMVSNLNIDIVQFAPVALYNFIITQLPASFAREGTVIIDMGANNCDLVLMEENKFWIRNLPVVGNTITKCIQDKLEISYADAERLKTTTTAEQSQEAGKIFGAIQSVLKDLASEIHRSIGFYKSLTSGRTVTFKNMILAGNATKMLYFEEFLSQRLQLAVSRLGQLSRIDIGGKVDKPALEKNLPSLGVAFGLALQGLGRTPTRINLMPPELIKIKTVSRKKVYVGAIAGVLLVLVYLLHLAARATTQQLEKANSEVQAVLTQAEKINKEWKTIQVIKDKEDYLKTITGLGADREINLRLLDALNNIEPLSSNILTPAKGYVEKANQDDMFILQENEKKKIWILSLKLESAADILNVNIICGIVARQKPNGDFDSVASQDFVKDQLIKPLKDEFQVADPKISLMDNKPVPRLATNDELSNSGSGDETEEEALPKYCRLQIQMAVPISVTKADPSSGGKIK